MGSTLPEGWQQVCTKGHTSDHSSKCSNWICPQGRRYKEWADVQAYFQLLNFEEDIPGVECRPENARRVIENDEEEEVTLEEKTKKEMDEKAKKAKEVKARESKRKRNIPEDESTESDEEVEQVSKKKGKKTNADDDYEPEANSKNLTIVSPKKTRRSVAAAAASKEAVKENSKLVQNEKASTTLEETSDVPKKAGASQGAKNQSAAANESASKKAYSTLRGQQTTAKLKPTNSSDVINLDTPVKDKSTAPSKSVSIVKIDDDIQEVKSTDNKVGIKEDVLKSSTQKLYDTRFELFKDYCAKAGGGVDPMKASVAVVDKFLQQLQKEKNLGKSVLSGYKSAIVKIQSENKSQTVEVKPITHPIASKTQVVSKSVTTRATITPVEANAASPPAVKVNQVISKSVQAKSATQTVTTPVQQPNKQQVTPQTRAGSQQQTPQARTTTPQTKSGAINSQQKQSTTPVSQPTTVRQQAPQGSGTPRQQTPQSSSRQTTPQSVQRNQTPQSSNTRQASQSNIRNTTPQSAGRQQVVQQQVRPTGQVATPRGQGPRTQTTPTVTTRMQGPQVRGITRSPQQRQVVSQSRQQAPQPRQQKPQAPNTPQPRQEQQLNQVRQQLPKTVVAASSQPKFTELPAFLKGLVNFPCKLETNAGGGPSLYRAAAQHAGVGQDGWQELRKYCHVKLLEWWQWYQPYYTFPIQIKLRMRNQTIQKTVPNSAEFQKFLKSDESLYSFHMSECELYCLANILGVPIYQLTYNLVGVGGKPEERCRWDTLDPHHGLIHQNKFNKNKEPFYVLYEDKIHFSKIVQNK